MNQKNEEKLTKRPLTASSNLEAAIEYARQGLPVVPLYGIRNGACACSAGAECDSPGKHPRVIGGVHAATTNANQIRMWWAQWPSANIGIATGAISGIIVLDIDPRNGGRETYEARKRELGQLPARRAARTGGGGRHIIAKYPDVPIRSDSAGKVWGPGIDLLSDGHYMVAPPSRHVSGRRYEWMREGFSATRSPTDLPKKWLAHLTNAQTKGPPSKATQQPGEIVREGGRNTCLTSMAGSLRRAGATEEVIRAALMAENDAKCVPPLAAEEVSKIAASIAKYPAVGPSDAAEALMEEVLSNAFAGGRHLLVESRQFWHFTGSLWRHVDDAWIRGRALDTAQAKPTPSRSTTASLIRQTLSLLEAKLTASDDRLSFRGDPPQVINCANGEVWLDAHGNAELRPHNAQSYLRHCLAVTYDPAATCPEYDKAIREIFSCTTDPNAMVRCWHELVGYLIQPRRNIPLIVILLGRGDNGKTVLARTIIRLLGAEVVSAQQIGNLDGNRFAMGSLFGKLLFIDDDVKAGARLPDGILKTMSEAKEVTGEEKFKPTFNFVVRALPMLLCNNVPSVADLSWGFMRRLRVIPFNKTFTEDEKDVELFERIWASELPGILNRSLHGLQRMLKRKSQFAWPHDVSEATRRFVREANPLPGFIKEQCERGASRQCLLRDFYASYCTWAEANGITMKQQLSSVRKNLEHLGCAFKHSNKGTVVTGLHVRVSHATPGKRFT